MSRLEPRNEEESEGETIHVDMLEVKKAQSPDTIRTTALGPCVGLFVYDPVTKQAIGTHLVNPVEDQDILADMLEEIEQMFPVKQRLRIYLGGSGPTKVAPLKQRKEERSFIEEELKRRGFQQTQIEVRWSKDPYDNVSMILNTQSGEFEYLVQDDSDYI